MELQMECDSYNIYYFCIEFSDEKRIVKKVNKRGKGKDKVI